MKLLRTCGTLKMVENAKADKEPGTFSGYGSVFNNLNSYNEQIAPGAFSDSLKQWKQKGNLPKMLLQHGSGGGFFGGGNAEDGIPIGVYTEMYEDDKGLFVAGKLFALNTQKGQYIHEGLLSGALDGLSVGFAPEKFEINRNAKDGEPDRIHTKVDLWECSVVTFPADGKASITQVLSALDDFAKISDYEDCLRDAGFSRAMAVKFVSKLKQQLYQSDSDGRKDDDMAKLLKKLAAFK